MTTTRAARTTLSITLTEDGKLVLRGPCYNRELCLRMLKLATQAIGDGMPAQTDAGAGGQRLLIPTSGKLLDLHHAGKRKV